jgi:gas vesicle protein
MARWKEQDSASSGLFLLGALAGALVGAGVALLMAPKSGVETRRGLSSGFNTARDAAARRYRDLADKASQKLGYDDRTTERYNGGTVASSEPFTTTPGSSGYQS